MQFKIKIKVMEPHFCRECGHCHEHAVWKDLRSSLDDLLIFKDEEAACNYVNTYSQVNGYGQENFEIIKI